MENRLTFDTTLMEGNNVTYTIGIMETKLYWLIPALMIFISNNLMVAKRLEARTHCKSSVDKIGSVN